MQTQHKVEYPRAKLALSVSRATRVSFKPAWVATCRSDAASMRWERVYTVNGFYDGPRLGVADYNGRPHIYESEFSEVEDDYSGLYRLSEVEPAPLALILEDWEIWLRWEADFKQGKVGLETHPALPHKNQRSTELKQLIGDRLRADPQSPIVKRAEFRHRDNETEVHWSDPGVHEDRCLSRRSTNGKEVSE
jgi:hypothetical protein